jgi:hypothetical protein
MLLLFVAAIVTQAVAESALGEYAPWLELMCKGCKNKDKISAVMQMAIQDQENFATRCAEIEGECKELSGSAAGTEEEALAAAERGPWWDCVAATGKLGESGPQQCDTRFPSSSTYCHKCKYGWRRKYFLGIPQDWCCTLRDMEEAASECKCPPGSDAQEAVGVLDQLSHDKNLIKPRVGMEEPPVDLIKVSAVKQSCSAHSSCGACVTDVRSYGNELKRACDFMYGACVDIADPLNNWGVLYTSGVSECPAAERAVGSVAGGVRARKCSRGKVWSKYKQMCVKQHGEDAVASERTMWWRCNKSTGHLGETGPQQCDTRYPDSSTYCHKCYYGWRRKYFLGIPQDWCCTLRDMEEAASECKCPQ